MCSTNEGRKDKVKYKYTDLLVFNGVIYAVQLMSGPLRPYRVYLILTYH